MTQAAKAHRFTGLHVPGRPLVLYNAWDAGSARAVLAAGAAAIATSSWALAAAQGHQDGEDLPLDRLLDTAARIAASVDAPVSVDFEGGYAEDEAALADNLRRLLAGGIVGINFEDRVVKGPGLYSIEQQSRRIAALRQAAEAEGVPMFINARTDLFLGRGGDPAQSAEDAIARSKAYALAGASGFFIPGLVNEQLISRISEASPLPVNVMMMEGVPPLARLAQIGVARVSYGAAPYAATMAALKDQAAAAFSEASAFDTDC